MKTDCKKNKTQRKQKKQTYVKRKEIRLKRKLKTLLVNFSFTCPSCLDFKERIRDVSECHQIFKIKEKKSHLNTFVPPNPMNSRSLMILAGKRDIKRLNDPTPNLTPISKSLFVCEFVHYLWCKMCQHSLIFGISKFKNILSFCREYRDLIPG